MSSQKTFIVYQSVISEMVYWQNSLSEWCICQELNQFSCYSSSDTKVHMEIKSSKNWFLTAKSAYVSKFMHRRAVSKKKKFLPFLFYLLFSY